MCSNRLSGENSRSTRPMLNASCAVTLREESSRSAAWPGPTIRGSNQAMPCSAISPRLAKDVENTAVSLAKRMSLYKASTNPSPAAAPLIALMTGLRTPGKYE
ncbi:hypothetical protein D3C73_1307910 [compost metagenome]